MHVLHLNTNSGKMSKSKGEFLTVSLLEEKGYDPLAYRLFCLQSHYRKSLVFSWENLDNAQVTYNKLITRIAALKPGDGAIDETAVEALKAKFSTALDNDLNTSLAVTAVYDILKAKTNDDTKLAAIDHIDSVLGLQLNDREHNYGLYGLVIMIWAALMSVSRVMLAAHYLADVLVGSLFGMVLGFTLAYAMHKLLVKAKL